MQNCVYDGTFFENILIVGKTACGKTYFTQKLTLNKFFVKLVGLKIFEYKIVYTAYANDVMSNL